MPLSPGKLIASLLSETAIAGSLLIASAGFAQAQEADGVDTPSSMDIIVTAERRGQSLQTVPASISAFDGQALKELRVTQAEDLTKLTPGLTLRSTGVSADPLLTVRGIGMNNGETNQNPAVTAYLNEIALPSHAFLGFPIFDMERVEVLKGPQGTLYGRNTTGGAINFITRRPKQELEANFRADYGNYNLLEIEGGVSGGLTETLAARLSFTSYTRHGWQKLFLGNEHGDVDSRNGDIDRKAIRGTVVWNPSPQFDATLVLDYARNNSETMAYKHAGNLKADGSRTPCSYPTTGIRDDVACGSYSIPRNGVGGPATGPRVIFSDPSNDPKVAYGSFIFGNDNDAETGGVALLLNYDFGGVKLSSVTGYRDLKRQIDGDDGSPAILSDVERHQRLKVFSQELRLASTGDGPFDWILGAYYTRDTNRDQAIFNQKDQFAYSALFDSRFYQKTKAWAAFGQASYELTDGLKATVGLRYTDEKKTYSYDGTVVGSGPFPVPIRNFNSQIEAKKVSGKVGLDYQVNSDLLLYANASRAFKGGGYPATITFTVNEAQPFAPEEITAYEAGFKAQLIRNVLRINGAGYYYDWKDFQATTQVNRGGVPVTVLATAGDAEIKGVELEVVFSPIPDITLRSGVNWMDSDIKNGRYAGQRTPNAPEWTVNSVLRIEPVGLTDGFRPFFQMDGSWNSATKTALPNTVATIEPDLLLLNARMGLKFDNGFEIAGWVRNLTDTVYRTQILGPGSASLPARFIYGDPITYGVSASISF